MRFSFLTPFCYHPSRMRSQRQGPLGRNERQRQGYRSEGRPDQYDASLAGLAVSVGKHLN